MVRGLYTSALGMISQMNKMDVVTNNIANADTTGYKKDVVVTRSFSEELMKRLDDPADLQHSVGVGKVTPGVFVDDIFINFSNGSLRSTGAPLDVAIMGDGFFNISVVDEDGNESVKYTRRGAFTLSPEGALLTSDGNAVLGEAGPIVIPQGTIIIDETGGVFSNGEFVDRFLMTNFEDSQTLRKCGDTMFNTTEESVETAFTGTLSSGYLENSNVNSVKEMVDMITVSRIYEANQRMITIHDSIMSKAVNDVGRR